MKDANIFTMAALKRKLRSLNLPQHGNKTALILRLNQADQTGHWTESVDVTTTDDVDIDVQEGDLVPEEGHTVDGDVRGRVQVGGSPDRQLPYNMELQFVRRENELMRRELELAQRENEFLRHSTQQPIASTISQEIPSVENTTSKINLTSLKDLIIDFDGRKGSYRRWEEQIWLLQQTYQLDNNSTRLLIGSKLRGSAEDWFHSDPGHLLLTTDQLWDQMRRMFDQRDKRLTLRGEFEKRTWHVNETFAEYCHSKIIMANQVPIDDDEMVDYLIEGIPNPMVRYQALMQQFENKEEMMRGMENVSLRAEMRPLHRNEKRSTVKEKDKALVPFIRSDNESGSKPMMKCFNCNLFGHVAANCQRPKRERGACFKCYRTGHKTKDCGVSKDASKENKSTN